MSKKVDAKEIKEKVTMRSKPVFNNDVATGGKPLSTLSTNGGSGTAGLGNPSFRKTTTNSSTVKGQPNLASSGPAIGMQKETPAPMVAMKPLGSFAPSQAKTGSSVGATGLLTGTPSKL